MKILEKLNSLNELPKGELYVKESNISIIKRENSYNAYCTITIVDLENAFRRGKFCKEYIVKAKNTLSYFLLCKVFKEHGVKGILKMYNGEIIIDDIEISIYELKAIRVFSPFAFNVFKPLKEIPKKLTKQHVFRLLANNQCKCCLCESVYELQMLIFL